MIYVDSSVALAQLLSEPVAPTREFFTSRRLIASRLLEYEIWVRLHACGATEAQRDDARKLIGRVKLVELAPRVLARDLMPFPTPLRTLDAIHLATIEFIRAEGDAVELASYDTRLLRAAAALDIPAYEL